MPINTKTEIPDETTSYYDRTLLERLLPLLCYTKFGQVKDIPAKSGSNTIKFRRYNSLASNTTALTEGVTPVGKSGSVTDITADVLQYGDYMEVSDVVQYESEDAVLTEFAQLLGEQAGESIEELARDVLVTGSTVQYADNRANRYLIIASSLITANEIRELVATMANANAKKITRIVNPTTGFNTTPVAAAYMAIVHPNVAYTLKTLTGWIPVQDYPSQADVMEGEIGSLDEVRFIQTTNAKKWTAAEASAAVAVYGTVVFGKDAYGISRISGEAMKNIIKPLGSGGTSDPLNQRATTGWKATFVTKILNDNSMLRLETSAAI
jgi:N4-gp56 family major capsid protein